MAVTVSKFVRLNNLESNFPKAQEDPVDDPGRDTYVCVIFLPRRRQLRKFLLFLIVIFIKRRSLL